MPDFFGNLIDQILGFARAHEQWLPAIGFAFAFVKSLPLVALFVPGTALLLSIGAVLGAALRGNTRDERAHLAGRALQLLRGGLQGATSEAR